jgi:hypothetical protein
LVSQRCIDAGCEGKKGSGGSCEGNHVEILLFLSIRRRRRKIVGGILYSRKKRKEAFTTLVLTEDPDSINRCLQIEGEGDGHDPF